MKRIPILFLLLACVCCKKAETDPVKPVDNTTSVPVTAPTMSDGYAISWQKGDDITICVSDGTHTITTAEEGNKATFKGKVSKTLSTFKAVYPTSIYSSTTSTTNINIRFPKIQKGTPGAVCSDMMPMVCIGSSAITNGFTMAPVCGLLKFTLSGSDIKSVNFAVDSSNEENYLGGNIIGLNCSTLNTTIKNATEKYYDLTMTPASGSVFTPGDYYFCIITKSTSRTFSTSKMTYTKSDGSTLVRNIKDVLSFSSGTVQVLPGDEASEPQTSSSVHGIVKHATTGAPIKDVLVSDGVQIVKTGSDGKYAFTSNLTVAQNVFVIMPAEYEFSSNEWGGWSNHALLDNTKKDQQIDFSLKPRTDSGDNYRILMLGDPQQMSSRAHSGKSWTYVCNAINEYRKTFTGQLYQISLGDMVTNEIEVPGMAEAYLATQKTSGVLTFSVAGNHDHIQKADTYYASVAGFSKWFGPYNYAFNLGKQHFIFLDSVAWSDKGTRDYDECFNDQAINFLEKDLSYVDVGTTVHIITHCPQTKSRAGTFPSPAKNFYKMVQLLAGRNVHFWYGHCHDNSNYSYTASELSSKVSGIKSLESHVVCRSGGCWSCSGEVNRDGTPRGFVELDIKGSDVHWQYHSIDSNYDSTMYLLYPGRFKGEGLENVDDTALYCNVYVWDNLWDKPEVWVNGTKAGDMTRVTKSNDGCMSPLYQHFYKIWKAAGLMVDRDEPPTVKDCNHLFKYVPASGVKSVTVKVKDRWGDIHTTEITW